MDTTATALLFDFDGLLCDTERAAHESWVRTFAEFGLAFPDQVWQRMHGNRNGEAVGIAELAARCGRPVAPEVIESRRQLKATLASLEPLRPGVADLLAAADSEGCVVAVVSSSAESWVEPHLRRLGVRDQLAEVVTGVGLPPKPAPDLYQRALDRLGVRPEEAIAFEDSAPGVAAARAAGIRCVGVPSAVGRAEDVTGAEVVLRTLAGFTVQKREAVR
jgi:HAD superfamily hydrolase (TIGR01509 family)